MISSLPVRLGLLLGAGCVSRSLLLWGVFDEVALNFERRNFKSIAGTSGTHTKDLPVIASSRAMM